MTAPTSLLTFLTRAGIPYDHWRAECYGPSVASLPPHRLIVADDAAMLAGAVDATVATVPSGPAVGAPTFALAMAGAVPAALEAAAQAVETRSQRDRPLAPVSPEVGRLLYLLARARRARNALEIGAGAGASTLWLAAGLRQPGGRLVAIDRDSARRTLALGGLQKAGLTALVEYRLGVAERLLARLSGRFDLVLLDETAEDREGHLIRLFDGGHLSPRAMIFSHGGQAEASSLSRAHARLQVQPTVTATVSLGAGGGLFVAVTAAAPTSPASPASPSTPNRPAASI